MSNLHIASAHPLPEWSITQNPPRSCQNQPAVISRLEKSPLYTLQLLITFHKYALKILILPLILLIDIYLSIAFMRVLNLN